MRLNGDAPRATEPGSEAAPARVALRVYEPEVISHAVAELREIERRTGLERTLAIGALVLETFFGGDPRIWRDRRRNKNSSIRRLASHRDCPFCKSALNDAVGVYVAVRALPCVRTFGHITSSHVTAVLRLPVNERENVLREADNQRWSVRQLREHVTSVRKAEGERRGRPAASEVARVVSALRNAVSELESCARRLTQVELVEAGTRQELVALSEKISSVDLKIRHLCDGRPRLASVLRDAVERECASA